jgi:hypothetical protein
MDNKQWRFGGTWQATTFLGATAVMGVAHTSHDGGAMIYPEAGAHPPPDYHDPLALVGLGVVGVTFAAYKAWRKLHGDE